jgi:MerR family copper efflux transcriptional regulator
MRMTQPSLSIGLVAARAGCTVPTIRYYEEIGLLPLARRTDGGRRHYGDDAVRRLTFIRRCRDFGFSIDHVRELVDLIDNPQRPCLEIRDIATTRLGEVRSKLAELQALESSLSNFVDSCETACAGGAVVDCMVLDDLAKPIGHQAPACCGQKKDSIQ